MEEDKVIEQTSSKPIENRPGQPGNTIGNRWQPGQSGNPGGRAKDTLTPLLREFLNADNEAEKIAIVQQMISIAKSPGMRGQVAALKEIFDRIDGKVPETHKLESDVPVTVVFKAMERKDAAE